MTPLLDDEHSTVNNLALDNASTHLEDRSDNPKCGNIDSLHSAVCGGSISESVATFVDYVEPPSPAPLPPSKYKLWLVIFVLVYFAQW